jgi:hypothetical protein
LNSNYNYMYEVCIYVSYDCKGKGKAIPLQAWTGPEGSRRLRLPYFKTICKGPQCSRIDYVNEKSNDTIGNRTHDLPACSAVRQPTAPPRTPLLSWTKVNLTLYLKYHGSNILVRMGKWRRAPLKCNPSTRWQRMVALTVDPLHH